VSTPFKVSHTAEDISKLTGFLKRLDGETKVIVEHTGTYYEWYVNSKSDKNYRVLALNSRGLRYPSEPCKRKLLNQFM